MRQTRVVSFTARAVHAGRATGPSPTRRTGAPRHHPPGARRLAWRRSRRVNRALGSAQGYSTEKVVMPIT